MTIPHSVAESTEHLNLMHIGIQTKECYQVINKGKVVWATTYAKKIDCCERIVGAVTLFFGYLCCCFCCCGKDMGRMWSELDDGEVVRIKYYPNEEGDKRIRDDDAKQYFDTSSSESMEKYVKTHQTEARSLNSKTILPVVLPSGRSGFIFKGSREGVALKFVPTYDRLGTPVDLKQTTADAEAFLDSDETPNELTQLVIE